MPKVSICASVLNQSAWLEDMLRSVMAQTYTDWDMVLVDDGSTEDIAAVVAKFDHGGKIKLHRFEQNQGIPHGINWAFRNATGEYIKPLAADETLWMMALGLQVTCLDSNPGVAACFGLPKHGQLGIRPEWERYALNAQNRSRAQWLDTLLNLKDVPLGGCNALWRRSLHDELGYFDPYLVSFSDHEFYCRIVQKHDIHVLPYRVAEFRDDPSSVSNSHTVESVEKQLRVIRAKHVWPHKPVDGKFTIGIPVKNMPQYVLDAVRSIVAQTYKNWELLIVDDGSTDNTYEVIAGYLTANPDDRIRVIRFPTNQGDRHACNYALQEARGDYFTALSADDTIEPTYMERINAILKDAPLLDFVSTQTDFMGVDGKPYEEAHPFKQIEKAFNKSQEGWKARLRMGNVYFGVGTFRTEALRKVGGWKQEYGVLSDYAAYLEMLQRSNIHVIEEPLTHTRITGENMSTKFEPQWLMKTYAEIKKRFYIPRRKVIVATPFYSVSGFSPYIYSLVQTIKLLDNAQLDWDYWHPSGDAYVERVKNTILTKFLEDQEATDLLMVDSDMEWEIPGLYRMLMLQEDLIVGSYPQKNSWDKWTSRPLFKNEDGKITALQKNLPDGNFIIEGEDLAGGFMLIKRGVLERYAEAHPDLRYVDESADPSSPNRVYIEFFSAGPLADGNDSGHKRFWGEDRTFSRRLKAMGEKWWIYPNIKFGHWGMNGWPGNFNDYLQKIRVPEQQSSPSATQVLQ